MEEIMGLDGIRSVREWRGYAFGLPDRHPTVVSLWRGLLPMRSGRDVRWMFGGTCGAWWFENWIVDASNEETIVFLFAYRDFARLLFWSLVSRSIVL